jgi:hypothetical protein
LLSPCKSAIERGIAASPYYTYKWDEPEAEKLEFKTLSISGGGKRFLFMGDAIEIKSKSSDMYMNGKERENGRFIYFGDKNGVGEFFKHSYACGITMKLNHSEDHVGIGFDPSKIDIMVNFGSSE